MTVFPQQASDLTLLPNHLREGALIAGVDEVGRGCLFGPVVAGAVLFPINLIPSLAEKGIRDSKQLSPQKRLELQEFIKKSATSTAIASASVAEIDQINILQASLLAMERAVKQLSPNPDFCLIDGKFSLKNLPIPQKTIIKGDGRSLVIAAASIIAKVWRDQLMIDLGMDYPQYDLAQNKGYGTKKHLQALEKWGISPYHRLSFAPCRNLR